MAFRKSIKLAPGIRMNLSGGGLSWTLGPGGASIGIGKRGSYLNTGIPGTGLYSRQRISQGDRDTSTSPSAGTTTFTSTVSVSDDGQLTFRDQSGNSLAESRIEILKKQKSDVLHRLIQDKCDEINGQIDALGDIHIFTSDPTTPPRYEPREYEVSMPNAPVPKKAGFWGWLFNRVAARVAAENTAAKEDHQRKLAEWQAEKAEFDVAESTRKILLSNVLSGEVPAMERFFGEVLTDIVWPRETQISFEVSANAKQICISVDLPEIDDMPRKTASVPQRGFRLSVKEMGATWVQKLYMRHIHAIGFRLAGEAFAMLPTVAEVVLSAYSQRPSSATGQVDNEYLYSVRVWRADWESINFGNVAAIDVIEALSRFDLRRAMTKTGVFKPVEPFAH